MSSLAAIRQGLAANLTAAIDAQCNGYLLASPSPPCFEIEPGDPAVEFDQAMARGLVVWHLIVRGFVATHSDIGAQTELDTWLAPSGSASVKAAIESDPTLGGAASQLQVTEVGRYRRFPVAGQQDPYLGAEWSVDVWTTGT